MKLPVNFKCNSTLQQFFFFLFSINSNKKTTKSVAVKSSSALLSQLLDEFRLIFFYPIKEILIHGICNWIFEQIFIGCISIKVMIGPASKNMHSSYQSVQSIPVIRNFFSPGTEPLKTGILVGLLVDLSVCQKYQNWKKAQTDGF